MSEPDGVGFFFNRGIPLMLWEKAFTDQFRAEYGIEITTVDAEDPRIHRLHGKIMTAFFRDVRSMLDEAGKTRGGKRYSISAMTFPTKRGNDRFGLDVETWVNQGLVDQLSPIIGHFGNVQPLDIPYYGSLARAAKVRVYPCIIAWNLMEWTSGKPEDLCRLVTRWYQQGADGVAVWDPIINASTEQGRPEDHSAVFIPAASGHLSHAGNAIDLLGHLGHRELVAYWAEHGVPVPNTFPLLKLGDNEYSPWYPNAGF